MKAEKDKKTGKWLIQYRYTDWQGKRRKSTKRGFATKREAEEWLRNFLIKQKADFDMKFEDFWKMYYADIETRLREHTMRTKKYIVELKILPYFGNKRVNDITAADIRQWQNELIKMGYSPTYLKTINNQLSAIFNYAVRYYDLKSNPCAKAGSMGKSKAEEMDFWIGEEFRKFIDSVMNKRLSYMAFMTLYWTGMRLGELLALNPKDVDLEKRTISITKSYQRLGKKDVITPPKTPKSKRVITIPEFLAADIKDYMDSLYDLQENDRLFPITKYYLEHGILPIKEGSKQKQIEDYFSRNERLGYTIFVQSPLSQPLVHRNRKVYEKFAKQQNSPIEDMLSEQGRDDIKRVEGILIESFRRKYGHFPLWNSMGGSMVGQTKVMENNINIVNSFCQPDNYVINPIVSRSTIRELSRNPEWEWYENYLHAARMNLLILGMEYDEALEFINKNDTLGTYERMKKSGYLRKRLIV